MLGFFIDLILVVVIKGKVLDYIPSCSLKLFYALQYYCPFNYISVLTNSIVPGIVSLLFILYISAFFKPFFLL